MVSAVGGVASRHQGRRAFAPVARWLDEDREPTLEEQEALLAQPRRQANGVLAYWMVGGAIGFVNYLVLFAADLTTAFLVFAGVTFGSHAAAFSYLLVERTLRPLAAQAMVRTQPVRRRRRGSTWVTSPSAARAGPRRCGSRWRRSPRRWTRNCRPTCRRPEVGRDRQPA